MRLFKKYSWTSMTKSKLISEYKLDIATEHLTTMLRNWDCKLSVQIASFRYSELWLKLIEGIERQTI